VDIDDTLIDTDRRRWAAWCMVLNREIDLGVVRSSSSKKILTDLGCGSNELWKEFWKILLCWDRRGIELLRLDEPIQFAPEVLEEWAETLGVIYLTGRTRNMYEVTLRYHKPCHQTRRTWEDLNIPRQRRQCGERILPGARAKRIREIL